MVTPNPRKQAALMSNPGGRSTTVQNHRNVRATVAAAVPVPVPVPGPNATTAPVPPPLPDPEPVLRAIGECLRVHDRRGAADLDEIDGRAPVTAAAPEPGLNPGSALAPPLMLDPVFSSMNLGDFFRIYGQGGIAVPAQVAGRAPAVAVAPISSSALGQGPSTLPDVHLHRQERADVGAPGQVPALPPPPRQTPIPVIGTAPVPAKAPPPPVRSLTTALVGPADRANGHGRRENQLRVTFQLDARDPVMAAAPVSPSSAGRSSSRGPRQLSGAARSRSRDQQSSSQSRRPSRANMPSSPASDPKSSLLTNKVALAESKCSPSERLEGSCSAKETTENVSSFSERPQAPVRKDPVPIPAEEPIDQMPMNLVQVLETPEANTQRNEPNDSSQDDMEAQFDPSNQFPSDQMQHNGRLAAHMDLVNGDDIPFEEVLDVGNEQLQEFVNSPAVINHDATHGGEPTLSGDVEQDDGQSPEKRRRVYSFRTQDARMIRVGNFHMPSHPAALPGLQKTNRKEIPNPFVRHQNQMIIKTEEVEAPSFTLEMPGLPANIFLYVVYGELLKLNDSNKLFKSFMVDMGLLLNRNSHGLSSIIINEKELINTFRGIITCEFLNPPEGDDDITADSDWKDKVALKKVFSSLYDMTMGIGPLSTSLQGIRDDINKKIENLKENESVLLSLMDENFRFIFESRVQALPIY